MNKLFSFNNAKLMVTFLVFLSYIISLFPFIQAQAQETIEISGDGMSISSVVTDPMVLVDQRTFNGGLVSRGTPIGGNVSGGGNSGTITISGIPSGATVEEALLYWTVLTNSDEASNKGEIISFNGNVIAGAKIGFVPETACFSQSNTFAWKADVTHLVTNPGNGTHTISGFPGGNQMNGDDFTEGTTLSIVYNDPNSSLKTLVSYEGLVVTGDIVIITQSLTGFQANTSGPVLSSWLPVIGNGQPTFETITFDGSVTSIDFSNNALLDGGTSEIPAGNCSYTNSSITDCLWDDDQPDVSAAIGNGDISANVNYMMVSDCHTFVAMRLLVSTDDQGDIDEDGVLDNVDNCPNDYNPEQEDTDGSGIGDACECEGNFNCYEDDDCDGSDAATFKMDFGRSIFSNPCNDNIPCNGDFDCDADVDGTDTTGFKIDFGRSSFNNPCPNCEVGEWCVYTTTTTTSVIPIGGDCSHDSNGCEEGTCCCAHMFYGWAFCDDPWTCDWDDATHCR